MLGVRSRAVGFDSSCNILRLFKISQIKESIVGILTLFECNVMRSPAVRRKFAGVIVRDLNSARRFFICEYYNSDIKFAVLLLAQAMAIPAISGV